MSNEQQNFPEYHEPGRLESNLEYAQAVVNIIGSAFPVVGPMLATPIGWKITKLQDKRIREYFKEVGKYLEKLPQKILQSEEVCDAVKLGITDYLNAPSEKERQFVRHLNTSFFGKLVSGKENEEKDCQQLFDTFFEFSGLLNQLSLPALDCLIAFKVKFPKRRATRFEIVDEFERISPLFGKRAFLELENNGILLEEGTKEQPPSFNNVPRIETDLGRKIYKLEPLGAIFSD